MNAGEQASGGCYFDNIHNTCGYSSSGKKALRCIADAGRQGGSAGGVVFP
jgi:hypothetical protein